jgi:hypothetical protein
MDVRLRSNFVIDEIPLYHPQYDKLEFLEF